MSAEALRSALSTLLSQAFYHIIIDLQQKSKTTTDHQQHKPLASSDSFLVTACFNWQKQKERRDRFE
jgi:hypothetical protein